MRKRFFVAALVLMASAFIVFLATRPRRWPPLPNPNGYNDFLSAAMLVTGDPYAASTNTHEVFRDFMATNAEPLRLARLGLTRRCAVPTEGVGTNFSPILNDLAGLKRVGQLIAAEGKFAEQENRIPDAVQSYLTAIRYGNEMSRNGFIINRLVGIACEAMGFEPLVKLVPRLTCDQSRVIVAELEKMDRDGVTWKEIMHPEHRYLWADLKSSGNPLTVVSDWRDAQAAVKKAEQKHNRLNARLRLLTVELTLLCYQAEQGRVPERLEQLVPKYLQRVPEDPFSHRPLIYRPNGTNWLLYSVGIDGIDDGGKPVQRSVFGTVQKGDLFYDSPY